jgi:exosortase E/protease (VPEID-CTERM system)
VVISVRLDNATLTSRGAVTRFAAVWGPWVLRFVVAFAALFVTFAYLKSNSPLRRMSAEPVRIPIGWGLLAAHVCALLVFAGFSSVLYGSQLSGLRADLIAIVWVTAGVVAIVAAAFALVPSWLWMRLFRSTDHLWGYALVAVFLACVVGDQSRLLWQPTTSLTFGLVKAFLKPLVARVVTDPKTMVIGTPGFAVSIAPECSGFEGAGLILAFGVTWIWVFRRECRFPQALLLIPAGVVLLFLLNALRIALLILIGDAGAPRIALGGFHSQSGWIAFNAVALGFSIAARRVSWLAIRNPAPETLDCSSSHNPTAAYVMPFLVILAAGMITRAAAADVEWLYPLRFFAAAGTLWVFRRKYAELDWKCGWTAPAIGALVFAIWIAMDRFAKIPGNSAFPAALAAASPVARDTWIAFRALAPVLTVPLAEELAFRGFLIRRLISSDFESIPLQKFTWAALLISSLAFGLLHGNRWLAGTIAGMLYGLALVRRGRIGEPVVAHATTNALLAAYVLVFHQWSLW